MSDIKTTKRILDALYEDEESGGGVDGVSYFDTDSDEESKWLHWEIRCRGPFDRNAFGVETSWWRTGEGYGYQSITLSPVGRKIYIEYFQNQLIIYQIQYSEISQ